MGRLCYIMGIKIELQERKKIEKALNDFLNAYKLKLLPPVDVFQFATQIGFDVRGTEFKDNLEGLILANENLDVIPGFDSNKVIAYNCKASIETKKFIVAHELAHYISAKHENVNEKIIVAARDHSYGYSNDADEQCKDYMAAAILIPMEDFKNRYSKNDISQSQEFYNKVAEFYNVDVKLAERRTLEVFYEQ